MMLWGTAGLATSGDGPPYWRHHTPGQRLSSISYYDQRLGTGSGQARFLWPAARQPTEQTALASLMIPG